MTFRLASKESVISYNSYYPFSSSCKGNSAANFLAALTIINRRVG